MQVDSPDLAMERQIYFRDQSDATFLQNVELHIDALNMTLADIPPECVCMHVW